MIQAKALGRVAREYNIPRPWDGHFVVDENAPQQKSASVDCGVAVLYVISKYFEQQPVVKKVAEDELDAMRTNIVETLLNWAKGQSYYVGQLKKRRVT